MLLPLSSQRVHFLERMQLQKCLPSLFTTACDIALMLLFIIPEHSFTLVKNMHMKITWGGKVILAKELLKAQNFMDKLKQYF